MGCDLLWSNLRHYLDIFAEVPKKTTKSLSKDSLSPDGDLTPEPLEHEAGILTTRFFLN
jgi:hypothetical protein